MYDYGGSLLWDTSSNISEGGGRRYQGEQYTKFFLAKTVLLKRNGCQQFPTGHINDDKTCDCIGPVHTAGTCLVYLS